jgi:hypothetical protein
MGRWQEGVRLRPFCDWFRIIQCRFSERLYNGCWEEEVWLTAFRGWFWMILRRVQLELIVLLGGRNLVESFSWLVSDDSASGSGRGCTMI